MQIDFTKEEVEILQAIFNSNVQLPVSHAEIVVSIKQKLATVENPKEAK